MERYTDRVEATAQNPSYSDYLALEETEGGKYEWRSGAIVAMAGGTVEHGQIAVQVSAALVTALRGGPCRVLNSDVKIRIETADRTTYPDVSVVGGPVEKSSLDRNAVTNPQLVVEVLSEGTEAEDRGAKFAAYQQLESLREYLLVSQSRRRFELFRRRDRGVWELHIAEDGETVALETGNLVLSVDEAYDGVLDPRR